MIVDPSMKWTADYNRAAANEGAKLAQRIIAYTNLRWWQRWFQTLGYHGCRAELLYACVTVGGWLEHSEMPAAQWDDLKALHTSASNLLGVK